MRLAAALSERSNLQNRLSELNTRLERNALVQEGEKPAEDPKKLLAELAEVTSRLEYLISSVNLTNTATIVDGRTLTEMLAHRDVLKLRLNALRKLAESASQTANRYSRSEVKTLSTVSVPEIRKTVDALSKELRELDDKIQEVNWTTDLKDSIA